MTIAETEWRIWAIRTGLPIPTISPALEAAGWILVLRPDSDMPQYVRGALEHERRLHGAFVYAESESDALALSPITARKPELALHWRAARVSQWKYWSNHRVVSGGTPWSYDNRGAAVRAIETARTTLARQTEAQAAYVALANSGNSSLVAKALKAASAARVYGPDRIHASTFPAATRQQEGTWYVGDPVAAGLREVGTVRVDTHDFERSGRPNGWYCDEFGGSTMVGVVFQLTGKHGRARYVPGYRTSDDERGATVDFDDVHESEPYAGAEDSDAQRDAAGRADDMARKEAEQEREYQTAWQAGSRWASLAEEIAGTRKTALRLLREFRTARKTLDGLANVETLCDAIREKISDAREEMRDAREEQRELAAGNSAPFIFWNGDNRLAAAFLDGSGISKYPE